MRSCCACAGATTRPARAWRRSFGDEPRLRLMGFTDRMGDVLAASDALIHSSAGLTVLEAIIRGCPVISYGFGYGHVRASNARAGAVRAGAGRAQRGRPRSGARAGARAPARAGPSFARRPSTASLILANERRARRSRAGGCATARAATAAAATLAVVGVGADDRSVLQPRLALRPHAPGDRRRDRPGRRSGCSSTRPRGQFRRWPRALAATRDPRLVRASARAPTLRRSSACSARRSGDPATARRRARAAGWGPARSSIT